MKNRPLLTTNNAKTVKGEKLNYKTYILYLLSHKQNSKRINLCAHASKGCILSCLVNAGHGSMSTVYKGRLRKTDFFINDKTAFLFQISNEIDKAIKKHEGKETVVVRLNGTSDISWEDIKCFEGGLNIFEKHSDIQFYDYTKNFNRFDKVLPSNYHLTFSRSETNHDKAMELLKRGINVAIVFDKVPSSYMGFEVVNGDETDLRFLDKKNVIVGLKYKKVTGKGGGEKNKLAFESGFVIKSEKEVVSDNYIN